VSLELRNVVKRVGAETHIYETSLKLAETGFNILLGSTLAGKTTLMQLMAGLDRPTAGEVWFNGRDVTARELPRFVAAMPVGKTVDVVVVRKGAELAKSITLGRLPEDEVKQANLKADDKDIDKPALKNVIGLDLLPLTDETRRRYSIKPTFKGVVVSRVDPNSNAAYKRIQAGEVIVEIGQEPVASPADVTKRLDAIKKDGKKSALLLIANAQGEVRFVALPIE